MCVPCCASNSDDRCAIIDEVTSDWNYENPGIYVKALSFSARAACADISMRNAPFDSVARLLGRSNVAKSLRVGVARRQNRLESAFIPLAAKRFS
jgi:hypothetical protein